MSYLYLGQNWMIMKQTVHIYNITFALEINATKNSFKIITRNLWAPNCPTGPNQLKYEILLKKESPPQDFF